MPLERFYRLSEEKKKVIRNAAVKEFARVPIDKVSINKIIKDADISRGSFYTYFEDKWDVLAYIFEDGQKKMRQFCIENLKKQEGDIWKMLTEFLDEIIEEFSSENNTFEFFKNVMMHSSSEEMFGGFHGHMKRCDETDELESWLYKETDKSEFKSMNQEDFHLFLLISMPAMAVAVKDIYQGSSKEDVRADYKRKLEFLRYGVCSK